MWSDIESRWKFQLSSQWLAYRNHLHRDEVDHHFQSNLQLDKDLSQGKIIINPHSA
jgi:hypothetical protein